VKNHVYDKRLPRQPSVGQNQEKLSARTESVRRILPQTTPNAVERKELRKDYREILRVVQQTLHAKQLQSSGEPHNPVLQVQRC